jgi:hypothetical protein
MAAHKHDNHELDNLIHEAVKKLGCRKENDICRYLPGESGGYIHHFTMSKMRKENPEKLKRMIREHIIESSGPSSVPPKPRAARGSRKRRDQILFTKIDIERMLSMARQAGDNDMVRKLTPRKDPRTIKRELIASIRHNRIEQDLWQSYVETVGHLAHAFSS